MINFAIVGLLSVINEHKHEGSRSVENNKEYIWANVFAYSFYQEFRYLFLFI